MRDVKLDEIVVKVAEEYRIPKRVARKMVRHMFDCIFRVMATDKHRVLMIGGDINQVYKDYDVQALCGEMIEGNRKNYNQVFTRKKRRIHAKYIKTPMFHLMD
jgi:hypothetical protein